MKAMKKYILPFVCIAGLENPRSRDPRAHLDLTL